MQLNTYKEKKSLILQKLKIWCVNFLFLLLFLISVQYLKIEIFYKEKNKPFAGDFFYNPYKTFKTGTLKANFHAHSKDCTFSPREPLNSSVVYDHYRKKGYDITSLSDYQKITIPDEGKNYIPVYEHGYNLLKSHQLVINSERVSFFDFSVFTFYHTRQQVINRLKQRGGLVALAHPKLRNGYTASDMEYLKGYDFIEVFNNCMVSTDIWDAALTSGYPAWILANDDCHDIRRPDQFFNNWTRISASDNSKEEILNSLKKGCHYGVRNRSHRENNFLDSCVVTGNVLKVYFRNKADRILFFADDGILRKEVINTKSASYLITPEDHYVRIETVSGEEKILLNPVIRFNGYQLTYNMGFPLVNTSLTIFVRFIILIVTGLLLLTISEMNGIRVIPIWLKNIIPSPGMQGNLSPG